MIWKPTQQQTADLHKPTMPACHNCKPKRKASPVDCLTNALARAEDRVERLRHRYSRLSRQAEKTRSWRLWSEAEICRADLNDAARKVALLRVRLEQETSAR